eukprot:TRINITY_DN13131_c0_g1_i1.p1 TRINITY_DN13131_c0_g1~~TRINITY_DN13131_c0_g1_i1.p1  ORF type:complete len:206 (-),score=28.04 TRINITY_DN13131_c0_g1_i1:34-651(-)
MKMSIRSLVLLSGGIDSVTAMHLLQSKGRKVLPVFVNYSQRGAVQELKAAKFFCDALGLELIQLDLSQVGDTFRNLQTQKLHIPIHHRNLPILSLAVSLAAQEKLDSIVLSVIKDDFVKDYQSSSLEFVEAFRAMIRTLEPNIEVETPLKHLTKLEVLQLAKSLDIPLERTYTCMRGHEEHCGNCTQCRERMTALQAFQQLRSEE